MEIFENHQIYITSVWPNTGRIISYNREQFSAKKRLKHGKNKTLS